jgi:hypothetical protein
MSGEMTDRDSLRDNQPEHERRDKPGAEREDSEAADKPPAAPADDDAPLGDTDQHSEADA